MTPPPVTPAPEDPAPAAPPPATLPPLARMPLSAPRWLWLAYACLTAALGAVAVSGGSAAVVAVCFEAGFSFQFWALAAHRGLSRHLSGPGRPGPLPGSARPA